MNACVNAYEMKMPAHYMDMNKKEMEYDGGWWPISLGLIVVGLICTAIGHATGNATVSAIGTAAAVAGLVYSGIGLVAGALGSTVATGDLIMLTPSVVSDGLSCAGFAYDAAKSYNESR